MTSSDAESVLDRPATFSVLVVCTANQCRSPLAEFALARAARRADLGWTVSSAGTRAVPGRGPDHQVVRILTDQGEDLTGWSSRRVDPQLLVASDLILVMTQEHRAELAMLEPSALPRTHLLLNFAGDVAELDRSGLIGPRLGQLLLAAGGRAVARPAVEPLELADPVGRSRRAFRRCSRRVAEAAEDIAFGRNSEPQSGRRGRRSAYPGEQSPNASPTNHPEHHSV